MLGLIGRFCSLRQVTVALAIGVQPRKRAALFPSKIILRPWITIQEVRNILSKKL